jgi:hypothetical protein
MYHYFQVRLFLGLSSLESILNLFFKNVFLYPFTLFIEINQFLFLKYANIQIVNRKCLALKDWIIFRKQYVFIHFVLLSQNVCSQGSYKGKKCLFGSQVWWLENPYSMTLLWRGCPGCIITWQRSKKGTDSCRRY